MDRLTRQGRWTLSCCISLSSFYVYMFSSFLSFFHSIFISVITYSLFFLFLEHTYFPNAFFAVLHKHTNFPTSVPIALRKSALSASTLRSIHPCLWPYVFSFNYLFCFLVIFYYVLPVLHFLVSGRHINYLPEAFRTILHTLLVLLTISSCQRQSCCLSSVSFAVATEDVLTLQ